MKTKILITVLFFTGVFNIINAQETIKTLGVDGFPEATDTGDIYYKDVNNYFTNFLGEWLYDDGTTYFKVTFIKMERVRMGPTNTYHDKLGCEYLLKINGITMYDTYGANSNINTSSIANHIVGTGVYDYRPNKIDLTYREPPLNGGCHRYASGNLLLEYTPILGSADELIWTRTNNQLYGDTTECNDGTQMDTSEFLIPATMVLVEQ
ncbi:hypothetical protein ES677_15040 [Bizionia gelidisalsuginis]|uniref:DUF6705 domain-containing protein n=1 Tax=Bizionia gelidisalsuginis TaxID=291188 RepID=A0ABY3M6S4_9FLAO|nr:DUF6705 family protein [Bizionia gelidisalsuginis]TYC07535.1 hypothetical protein ES677_15040 [Bizionia gelidisalsuginis]